MFAKTGTSTVKWADEVMYLLGGDMAKEISSAEASDPKSWGGCPEGQQMFREYECPISVFSVVSSSTEQDEPRISTSVPKTIGCNRITRRPSWETQSIAVILSPESHSSCFEAYAVILELTPDGAVETVDLELSGP